MKILMLTASLPYPPQQGGALRSFGILHGLHQQGHEVTLLSFHNGGGEIPLESATLKQFCRRIETVATPARTRNDRLFDLMLSSEPDIARRLYSEAFLECLVSIMDNDDYDLVQFEGIEVACYLTPVKQLKKRAKLVYDAFNAEAALQQVIFEVDRGDFRRWPTALYSLIQSGRIARFERDLCQMADLVIAVSPEDADILRQYLTPLSANGEGSGVGLIDRQVAVVPNGIFPEDYAETSEQLDLGANALVFTGKMDYRPNVDAAFWFSEQVLPMVQSSVPQTKLYIVGQKPHPRLDRLRDKPGVEITGWVQDVQPFLRGASVYVAPLRMGSGTRLKILEAMASGCAVVATRVAASGMSADVGEAIIIRDRPEEMAAAILSLFEDTDKREILSKKARSYVRRNYDWSVLIPHLLKAYEGIGLG